MNYFFKLQKKQAVETTSPHNANMSRPLNHRANLNFSTKRVVTNLVALALVAVGISPISASAAQEDLIVSVANPGVQSYAGSGLSADADVLVESFDSAQWTWVCTQSYWDEWGEQCQAGEDRFDSPVGLFTTTFGYFFPADRWGGAGGTGQYAAAGEILLTISDQSDYRYLGFWWSAGSIGNDVQVSFPGVSLDAGAGEANAMLCIAEVADQSGTALTGSPTFQITDSGSTLTAGGDNSLRTYSGTRTNVASLSSGLVFTPSNLSQSFSVVGSRYLRVTATPQTNAGTAGCTGSATDSEIVEVRFVNMIQRNSFGIQIN